MKLTPPAISEETTIQLGAASFVALGVTGSLLYATNKQFDFASVASCALAVGGAALLLGCFSGFLFGIPRAAGDQSSERRDGTGDSGPGSGASQHYRPNTNLEQISDWLTKILVGVGLTQLAQAPEAAASLASALSPLLGGATFSGGFGVALALYYFVGGFFITYLWARMKIGVAFTAADLTAVGERVKAIEARLPDVNLAATSTRLQAVER